MEVIQMKKIYHEAGARIRLLREEKHYSREKLSEMAGISPKFLYEVENGHKGISAGTLYRITEALETNSDYILFGAYRGSVETEVQRILSLFDESKKETVLEILKLIASF